MIWSFLFAICIAQGGFLIAVLCLRKNKNALAVRLLLALITLFLLANFDDLLLSTGWYRVLPQLFGLSMSALLAYGPLLWMYSRSTIEPQYCWGWKSAWHFVPFLAFSALQVPFLLMPAASKIHFLDAFLSGAAPLRVSGIALFVLQLVHMFVYLMLTLRGLWRAGNAGSGPGFQVPIARRIRWLRVLMALFAFFFLITLALFLLTLQAGRFMPQANFVYTLVSTAIVYLIAGNLVLDPDAVAPDFSKKYQSVRLNAATGEDCLLRLKYLLETQKIFTQPDLKLSVLAGQLDVTPHQMSRLINETFGLSFSDLINRYRVQEFIARTNDPRYAHFSLLGIAFEVGFNSKSAFNTAFKKYTGRNPSELKK